MAQVLPRYCPRCGAPTVSSSRFCPTCGLLVEAMPSEGEHMQPTQSHQHDQDQMLQADQQTPQYYPGAQQHFPQAAMQPPQAGLQNPMQRVTRPFQEQALQDQVYPPAAKRKRVGRKGLLLLLLAIIVFVGAAGYVTAGLLGAHLPGFRVVQPAVTTRAINATIPYAGVDITVLNVQQSQSFIDDPNTSGDGMVRLNLREENKTNIRVSWSYNDIARLILPGRVIVSPAFVKARVGIAPGATQTSFVDFAVPMSDTLDQLTLRLGGKNEAQILVPLTGKADLSRYQPKTINLNGQMLYFGLNYTLSSAMSSLSIDGQQAPGSMRYIVVTLKVDNTLSQVAIAGSPYDYIRLKFGNTMVAPKGTTLPVSFDTGATGKTGTVSFLAPQNSTSFTLILLPPPQSGAEQASTNFQLT